LARHSGGRRPLRTLLPPPPPGPARRHRLPDQRSRWAWKRSPPTRCARTSPGSSPMASSTRLQPTGGPNPAPRQHVRPWHPPPSRTTDTAYDEAASRRCRRWSG